ncbi:hypothetical protein ACFL6Y_03210 [Elusimicrobiota bacterium]
MLTVMVPALVVLVFYESRWTISEWQRSIAFQMAEAGIDRAEWKLKEKTANWDTIVQGGSLANYDDIHEFEDVEGGSYKILITTGDNNTEVRIFSTGKDAKAKEFRALEVKLSKESIDAAIFAPTIGVTGGARIYWGPIMSLGTIDLQGSADVLYPRKMSRTSITRTNPSGTYWEDSDSGGTNTDGLECWSYNSYPVPDPPTINISSMAISAKEATCAGDGGYDASGDAGINGAVESCYFQPGDGCHAVTTKISFSGLADMTPKVRYFNNCSEVNFSGITHFRGHLIVIGDLKFASTGKPAGGGNDYGEYTVTVPANAWKEHQKHTLQGGDGGTLCIGGNENAQDDGDYDNAAEAEADDDCRHQYPGDEGYHAPGRWRFGTGCPDHGGNDCGYANNNTAVTFKGFIYVNGSLSATGTAMIHGSVMVATGGSWSGGGFEIFYDDTLEVPLLNPNYTRIYWKEVPATAF